VSREADTLELRQGIERTRADMSATIDAIQEQLNPHHIAEQVREQVRHQFDEAKATVRDATIGKADEEMPDWSQSGRAVTQKSSKTPMRVPRRVFFSF
jgi:hypothetical protein